MACHAGMKVSGIKVFEVHVRGMVRKLMITMSVS